jgi:hypothetical protein
MDFPGARESASSPRALDLSNSPGLHLLSNAEAELASILRQQPFDVIAIMARLASACLASNGLTKVHAGRGLEIHKKIAAEKIWAHMEKRWEVWLPKSKAMAESAQRVVELGKEAEALILAAEKAALAEMGGKELCDEEVALARDLSLGHVDFFNKKRAIAVESIKIRGIIKPKARDAALPISWCKADKLWAHMRARKEVWAANEHPMVGRGMYGGGAGAMEKVE